MKIYVAVTALDAAQKARLNDALSGHDVTYADELASPDARQVAASGSEVIFGNPPAAWLQNAPRLKWVQLDSAGVNAYLGLASAPVVFTNLNSFFGQAVAESALAGILAYYRQLPRLLVAQRERRWIKKQVEPAIGQLHGANVVILGAGAIGTKLAALLRPFEGEVKLFARQSRAAQLHTPTELDAALAVADIVVNSLPEVSGTVGILDRARLGRLRPSSLVVNVGRGSAIDEVALLDALNNERIAGAVLDVTTVEPLPADHAFWMHPKVILTQHTGGRFPGETDAKITRFLANFALFARGEPLPDPVNLSRGY